MSMAIARGNGAPIHPAYGSHSSRLHASALPER